MFLGLLIMAKVSGSVSQLTGSGLVKLGVKYGAARLAGGCSPSRIRPSQRRYRACGQWESEKQVTPLQTNGETRG
ncbi:hypothetical protein F5Y08DRAFT_311252, partial [Xylaria arbuscula]